jgi:peptidoglycan/xylan/chitin deacetylase (PgdA/CDA1 family)
LISFDDGRASDFALAMPALMDRNMRGVFFVTTDWIGSPGFMTPSQLREMSALGMDIQVHGKTHRFLTDLNVPDLLAELAYAKAALEDIVSKPVTALAYPGGRGGKQVRETAVEVGYSTFFCSRPGWYRPGMSEVPRMVVHGASTLGDIGCYLQKKPGPVIRQFARHHAGRILRMALGPNGYAKLKNLARVR